MRTHYAGSLRGGDAGSTITVCGWVAARRDHGGVVFLDLRDASGILQIVIDPATPAGADSSRIRSEFVLQVTGVVRPRPGGTLNVDLPTGEVEIAAESVVILNESEPPPFPLNDRADGVDESLRLRHRYLDLRRGAMQRNLRLRAGVNRSVRAVMDAQNFVEVETPMLIASTPEGARDFVVPSRLHPGEFYALPQSPQLFKQLLMVGGLDRYYQVARCLRDEDLRADRQFEFMQLDVEMSFADAQDVMDVVALAVDAAVVGATGVSIGDIPSITWQDSMERFG
ncbi:MAG: aspartate--tRNA ligase, partial [Actinobacteria bacterium]|nr:aspartate--tRNA ligase [Actinomycetota bacterium]